MIADGVAIDALNAVIDQGLDPSQPTIVYDSASGTPVPVAVVQQLPTGEISVKEAPAAHDVTSIVNQVVGFIDHLAGTLTNVGTQVKKIGNAVKGGAAGAQAGYDAPTDWKPILIGAGGLLAAAWILQRLARR